MPTMILDDDLVFVAVNQAYLDLFDLKAEDLIGKYVFDAFPETPERVQAMTEVFRAGLSGEEISITEIPFDITVDGVIEHHWWTAHHRQVKGTEGKTSFVVQYTENVTDSVKARELRDALTGELQHRIGNIFAIVSAVARQTARKAKDIPEFLATFQERIASLVKVDSQFAKNGVGTASIRDVMDDQLAVLPAEIRDRITVEGPDYTLAMRQVQALSMAVHELSTNSMKYGALGDADGTIDIKWEAHPDGTCDFSWVETGIRAKAENRGTGYGTMLLTTIIPRQLDGEGHREFDTDRFCYSLRIGRGD